MILLKKVSTTTVFLGGRGGRSKLKNGSFCTLGAIEFFGGEK
tara:strand:- start:780 stop:905 length:126 start_codon:yes stop_codon:yes gene_type:complete